LTFILSLYLSVSLFVSLSLLISLSHSLSLISHPSLSLSSHSLTLSSHSPYHNLSLEFDQKHLSLYNFRSHFSHCVEQLTERDEREREMREREREREFIWVTSCCLLWSNHNLQCCFKLSTLSKRCLNSQHSFLFLCQIRIGGFGLNVIQNTFPHFFRSHIIPINWSLCVTESEISSRLNQIHFISLSSHSLIHIHSFTFTHLTHSHSFHFIHSHSLIHSFPFTEAATATSPRSMTDSSSSAGLSKVSLSLSHLSSHFTHFLSLVSSDSRYFSPHSNRVNSGTFYRKF